MIYARYKVFNSLSEYYTFLLNNKKVASETKQKVKSILKGIKKYKGLRQ